MTPIETLDLGPVHPTDELIDPIICYTTINHPSGWEFHQGRGSFKITVHMGAKLMATFLRIQQEKYGV